jgi:hypothetical protein
LIEIAFILLILREGMVARLAAGREFPLLPNPGEPDCGNLYRNLKFPDASSKR